MAKLPRRGASFVALALLVVPSTVGVRNWYDQASVENYRGATRYVLAHERAGDGTVYYPPGTLRGPTSGFDYYEAQADAHGPTPVGFDFANGPELRPARIWLVMRRSDTPAQVQRELRNTLGRGYRQAGPPADFRNLIVILYRRFGA